MQPSTFIAEYIAHRYHGPQYGERLWRSRLALARHLHQVRPYGWRAIAAQALTDAACLRRAGWQTR